MPIASSKLKTKDRNVAADCVEFGKRLEQSMQRTGITQAELSRDMKVSRSAVNWWVQGNTYPSIDNAKRLADLLRTTPEYLLFGAVKVQKERLVDSIPVIDRVLGRQAEITRIALPKEFHARANLSSTENLKAMPLYNQAHPIIAVADTSDRNLSVRTPKQMVIEDGDEVYIGSVTKKRGEGNKILVRREGGEPVEMPFKDRLLIGRLAVSIEANPDK